MFRSAAFFFFAIIGFGGTAFARTIIIVSDTTTMLSGGTYAVRTWVHPDWTASIPGATWIWNSYHEKHPRAGTTETFTKAFTLPCRPSAAILDIAADNRYAVWINGKLVAQATAIVNFRLETQGRYTITSFLTPGTNAIVVRGINIPWNTDRPTDNPGGILYKITINCEQYADNNIWFDHSLSTSYDLFLDRAVAG